MSLAYQNIVLGVTGGIAAYKSADLVRRLREAGAAVRVVMTPAATKFITPLTFQALSGNPVHTELLDPKTEAAMGHIELSRWADAVLIAPCSADFIAKLSHGLANNLLSVLCLACNAPIALAPAMNRLMWTNKATQENVETLKKRGLHFMGPASGKQACGETGEGRMLEPMALVDMLSRSLKNGTLHGLKVLITAGPTREALDPVRYLTNHSSGKMGFALARAAQEAGATVTLISGPASLETPRGVCRINIETGVEMQTEVMSQIAQADIFIACAAVADYRPATTVSQKIKKGHEHMTLELIANPDIVSEVAALESKPFVAGFAAETQHLEKNARTKRERKGLDMIAANRVGKAGGGFNSDENALEVFWQDGHRSFELTHKIKLARQLIKLISEHYAIWKHRNSVITLHSTQN